MTNPIKIMCIHCVTSFVTTIVNRKTLSQIEPACASFVEVSQLCPNAKHAAAKAAESGYLIARKFINGAMYEPCEDIQNTNATNHN